MTDIPGPTPEQVQSLVDACPQAAELPLDMLIEEWRELDDRRHRPRILWPAPDEVYFAQLWEEVAMMRSRRGRFVGTSSVEDEALNGM